MAAAAACPSVRPSVPSARAKWGGLSGAGEGERITRLKSRVHDAQKFEISDGERIDQWRWSIGRIIQMRLVNSFSVRFDYQSRLLGFSVHDA